MYVAVKGGERAIENAHRLLAHERRGDPGVAEVTLDQISGQLSLGVDRVMSEGSIRPSRPSMSVTRGIDASGASAVAGGSGIKPSASCGSSSRWV